MTRICLMSRHHHHRRRGQFHHHPCLNFFAVLALQEKHSYCLPCCVELGFWRYQKNQRYKSCMAREDSINVYNLPAPQADVIFLGFTSCSWEFPVFVCNACEWLIPSRQQPGFPRAAVQQQVSHEIYVGVYTAAVTTHVCKWEALWARCHEECVSKSNRSKVKGDRSRKSFFCDEWPDGFTTGWVWMKVKIDTFL